MTSDQPLNRETSQNKKGRDASAVDVLVIGAGPTGLAAAVEALRNGLTVRIVERQPERGMFSKALVVHARTMEVFALMGVDGDIRKAGTPFAALNLHFNNRKRRVHVDLLEQPWGDTAYPYWLSVPQHDTERVLENRLADLGGVVEWSTALRSVEDRESYVDATVIRDGTTEIIRAGWVIGCDGGRSTVREQSGIALKRTGAGATFLLADVKTTSDLIENEGHLFLAPEGLFILVPMPEPRQWRLIAQVSSNDDKTVTTVDSAHLDELIYARAGITFGAHDVSWISQFNLSHGVADRFRSGRVFLAGDAAHIHSPVGGQGLNTGVQDAHNLMWRISESRRAAPERAEQLLAGYQAERQGTASVMVGGVARMTAIMTSPRFLARRLRSVVAPLIVSRAFVQAKLARGVGMLNLSYAKRRGVRATRELSVGSRLPNPELVEGDRLYDRLPTTGYSWVVCDDTSTGSDSDALTTGFLAKDSLNEDSLQWRGLPLVVVESSALHQHHREPCPSSVILVRPDRYIAAVGSSPESLLPALPTISQCAPGGRQHGVERDPTPSHNLSARTRFAKLLDAHHFSVETDPAVPTITAPCLNGNAGRDRCGQHALAI